MIERLLIVIKLPSKSLILKHLLTINSDPEAIVFLYTPFMQLADAEMTGASIVHFVSDQQCILSDPDKHPEIPDNLRRLVWDMGPEFINSLILDELTAEEARGFLQALEWE